MSPKPISVLLVEDDGDDVLLTKDALQRSKLSIQLEVVDNGEQAIAFLQHTPPYHDAPTPDLILLDLNLPRKNGWEVLEIIRQEAHLNPIPVIILTTSNQDPDIQRAYEMGANSFVTKPVGLEEFHKVVQSIEDFWLTIVKLPRQLKQ
ncbi:MAG: response regulator [Nitrospirales bacterium]